ncbi:MAG TPA: DUF3307 domain-containing protein [Flavobacterium sp.]|nr:DUF3307 domain-containing protein [Flavobacterium sp.]
MLELILKVITAHLLGDFVLQTTKMVKSIEIKKFKSIYLYIHILIHFILLLVITGFEKIYIIPAMALVFSHFVIDLLTKIVFKNRCNTLCVFAIDQLLHLAAIAIFIKYFYRYEIDVNQIFSANNYLFLIAVICLSYVSSILIKKIMEMFNYPFPNNGLENAGKYIGVLERLFIFSFIVMSFWEGIGFLLAAKSIFRFGDLKENKEIKLTEYIMIGTFLSFGIAILISVLYMRFRNS